MTGRGLARLLIGLIRAYQMVLSPMRPPTCRFYPSCSVYAVTALERRGLLRGTGLAARRLLRCHPWNPGGVDLVPPAGLATGLGNAPLLHDVPRSSCREDCSSRPDPAAPRDD